MPLDGSTAALGRLEACFEKNSRAGAESNPFVAPERLRSQHTGKIAAENNRVRAVRLRANVLIRRRRRGIVRSAILRR